MNFAIPQNSGPHIAYFYDALGRETSAFQPDGSFSSKQYGPLEQTIKDEEQTEVGSAHYGAGKRLIFDGLGSNGRLREVFEQVKVSDIGEPINSVVEWKTKYDYDALNNLKGYVDARGNSKISEYDGLSRKTYMNDPDRGTTYYKYDDAGNLIETTDAKGQITSYIYDGANRAISESYVSSGEQKETIYHYDDPYGPLSKGRYWSADSPEAIARSILIDQTNASLDFDINSDGFVDVADVVMSAMNPSNSRVSATNTKGRLAWVEDESGNTHRSFDQRGRVIWTIRQLNSGSGLTEDYYVGTEYDSMDRVTRLIYPDNTDIHYSYNDRGLLSGIAGVTHSLTYNPVALPNSLSYSNGISADFQYDSRWRLKSSQHVRTDDQIALQSLRYEYDSVSNVVEIVDERRDSDLEEIGNQLGIDINSSLLYRDSHVLTHDSLYRLIHAESNTYGNIEFRYDQIGNLITKNADIVGQPPNMDLGLLRYGGSAGSSNRVGRPTGSQPGPHALTSWDDSTNVVEYDPNGNVIVLGSKSLLWDAKDRLVSVSEDEASALYYYDYKNTRRLKKVIDDNGNSIDEVHYIDKCCEVRNGVLSKYALIGPNRVARQVGAASSYTPTDFFVHNWLNTATISLNENAEVTQQVANYPFGNTRLTNYSDATETINYQFTGKEQDDESKFHYFGARYYQSELGRFLSVDLSEQVMSPAALLENPQALNPYSYALNQPGNMVDPDGNFAFVPILVALVPMLFISENLEKPMKDIVDHVLDYTPLPSALKGSGKAITKGVKKTVGLKSKQLVNAANKNIKKTLGKSNGLLNPRQANNFRQGANTVAASVKSGTDKAGRAAIKTAEVFGIDSPAEQLALSKSNDFRRQAEASDAVNNQAGMLADQLSAEERGALEAWGAEINARQQQEFQRHLDQNPPKLELNNSGPQFRSAE